MRGKVPSGAVALDLWDSARFVMQHLFPYELKRNHDQGTPEALRGD